MIVKRSTRADTRLTCHALGARPSVLAHLVPVLAAVVMAENVVPATAELGASGVVVILVALDSYPVRQMSVSALMIESVPRGSGQDDAAVARFLDHAAARLVPRLQNQRELPLQQRIFTITPQIANVCAYTSYRWASDE